MRRVRILAALAGLAFAGCSDVPYYRKEALGRRVMQFDDAPLELVFKNKVYTARGVAGGKPGLAAGGGCGCSN